MKRKKKDWFIKQLATLLLVQEGLLPREHLGLSEDLKAKQGQIGRLIYETKSNN